MNIYIDKYLSILVNYQNISINMLGEGYFYHRKRMQATMRNPKQIFEQM
jgi:hypothetical protein